MKLNLKIRLSVLTVISGCILFFLMAQVANSAENNMDSVIEARIDSIIKQMSLEEKIFMLHGNSMFSSGGADRFGLSELNYTDGPFGVREEIERDSWSPAGWVTDSATYFPTGTSLAATWNMDLTEEYGIAMGMETRARDKDILLGPSVNLIRTPLSGRNFEFFTEDPYLNARLSVEYVNGMQSQDVAACIKHYVLNNHEKNRGRVSVEVDERTMRELYLPAFRAAVKEANVLAVMSAYNRVRGSYCSENTYLLNDILKGEWGFKGVVVSDWGGTHSSVNAALGGLDIEMGASRRGYFMGDSLLSAVKYGTVPESVIDAKVRRILYVLMAVKSDQPDRSKGEFVSPYIRDVAYRVASEAVVLLKNETKLLPLNADKLQNIVVIGDNATRGHALGGFGAQVKTKYEVTPLNALQDKYGEKLDISFVQGYEKNSIVQFWPKPKNEISWDADTTLADEAAKAAAKADAAILFVGLNHDFDTEANDRDRLTLPYGQDYLVEQVTKANPNTVVVIVAGSPVDMNTIKKCANSVLWMGLNGSECGNAIADVLFGKVNPSGKMPFTVPVALKDLSMQTPETFPGVKGTVEYQEGLLVGYRWFDTKNIAPAYEFGYGLSYVDFDYKSCKAKSKYKAGDTIELSVKVKNNSKFAGQEVVQVYASAIGSKVERPAKELKAFSKVMVKAGKTLKAKIKVKVDDLAYYNADAKQWIVEPGEYKLLIGSSSRDIRLEKTITIE